MPRVGLSSAWIAATVVAICCSWCWVVVDAGHPYEVVLGHSSHFRPDMTVRLERSWNSMAKLLISAGMLLIAAVLVLLVGTCVLLESEAGGDDLSLGGFCPARRPRSRYLLPARPSTVLRTCQCCKEDSSSLSRKLAWKAPSIHPFTVNRSFLDEDFRLFLKSVRDYSWMSTSENRFRVKPPPRKL